MIGPPEGISARRPKVSVYDAKLTKIPLTDKDKQWRRGADEKIFKFFMNNHATGIVLHTENRFMMLG